MSARTGRRRPMLVRVAHITNVFPSPRRATFCFRWAASATFSRFYLVTGTTIWRLRSEA